VKKFKEAAAKVTIGDQLQQSTTHGPLVDEIQFKRVLNYIEEGKKAGAKCEIGGHKIEGPGYFVPPTLFTNATDDMKIVKEEIFGPVAVALKFKTTEEVIERANKTSYGLAAAVHTKDLKTAIHVQNALAAGTVWVNCYNVFFNQVPFGGFKESGIGRELGEYGLQEYTTVKAVITNVA